MPQNIPDKDQVDGPATVFIDTSALSELPSQLVQQDLETFVGLSIHTSDLEPLQVSADGHVVDPSGVLISDGVSVGNIVEVADEETAMDTSEPLSSGPQSLEVDSLGEMDLLSHSHEFIPMTSTEELLNETSTDGLVNKHINTLGSMEDHEKELEAPPSNIVGGESLPTQILKTSTGQFVILQPNQIGNLNQSQPQFRTLQLKQPTSLSSDSQSSGVTKVILTSQPGNNLSQQLRLISSQANQNTVQHNSQISPTNPSKLAFQLQPLGLSLSSTKNIIQTPAKIISPTENKSSITAVSTPPQNIIIKSNIPLSGNATNLKPGQIIATTGSQPIKIPVNLLSQLSNQTQTLHLSNKKNFRIVSSNPPSSISPSNSLQVNNQSFLKSINVTSKPIAPANNKNAKITKSVPIQINQSPKQQRLIIPVSSQDSTLTSSSTSNVTGIQIRPQGTIALPASALPPGVLSNAQPGSLVMIPAHYFQNTNLSNLLQASNQNIPVSISSSQKSSPTKTVIDANVIKPRKPCNCTKSQCLKLYCDCFANGEFCNNCNCVNCYNNLSHEEDRQKAIKCCLERNPQAFRPKIGKGGSDSERRHNKGCNCKRSGCLKNYCECYEAKIPCSDMCKCVGCRNMDTCQPYERKRLMQLAEAAEARVNQHIAIKKRPFSLASFPSPVKMSLSLSTKNSYCRISQEVVEATCHCLLAQAEKAEKSKFSSQERLEVKVISEFSRCLLQIIGFNLKAKGNFVQ